MMGGAFGLAFMKSEDPRFRDLAQFHIEERKAWRERSYPVIAAELREKMAEDSEAFLRDVCITHGGPARYTRMGVLKLIPANEFAGVIAAAPYRDQKNVTMALSIRYEQVCAEPELEAEVPWLRDVQQQLGELGKELPRMARFHLSRVVKEYVDKALFRANNWLQQKDAHRPKAMVDDGRTAAAPEALEAADV